ncbi:MAG: LysE family translocator [SAR92 clade bacterium]|uniref:LysE family translocator n=1 Tax=SAR92 clade bacterium TaxID=2315479 RepID=A0A520MF12_9GAMM|nr:MAG: LysE family translocator [SAR92 clade bacterium]
MLGSIELSFWATVFTACLFGAMSPGPSLAVVVNHTLATGRLAGSYAAISHGIGIGIYALITAFGLSAVIEQNPVIFETTQFLGSLFLLYLGVKLIFASKKIEEIGLASVPSSSNMLAIRDGLGIALINPKILLFFTALFSQFVQIESSFVDKIILAIIAGGVDTLWYLLVVTIVSRSGSMARYQRASGFFDKIFGVLLVFIAFRFINQIVLG